jgi:cell shape-determining protein MreC
LAIKSNTYKNNYSISPREKFTILRYQLSGFLTITENTMQTFNYLFKQIAQLQTENEDLLEQIEQLQTENEQLEEEHKALIELCNYYQSEYEKSIVYDK